MLKNTWTKLIAGGLAVLALGVGVAATSAQTFNQSEARFIQAQVEDAPDYENLDGSRFGHRGHRGPRIDHEIVDAAVADALGISVEELEAARADGVKPEELAADLGVDMADVQAAVDAVRADALAQAVADGDITQAQADALLAQMELKQLARDIIDRDVIEAAIADTLGVSVEELEAAQSDRGAMADLVEAAGVTREEIQAAANAAKEEMVAAAVDAGTITAEQGDMLLSLEQGPRGGGHRGHGGPRGGHGSRFDRQAPDAPTVETAFEA